MSTYRFNKALPDKRRNVLVPVSGGVSSLALLHVLDQQLQRQRAQSQNRTSYDLQVLVVDTSSVRPNGPKPVFLEALKSRYPLHTYSIEPLSAVLQYDKDLVESLERLGSLRMQEDETSNDGDRLRDILGRLRSPTSRADMIEILLTRLVASFAKHQGCQNVLWGHSDSRLAAKTLSSVAQGRGGSVPQQIRDGPSPWDVVFNYPVRELFKPELELFLRTADASLADLIIDDRDKTALTPSMKDMSIDGLLNNYITSQGEKYPSIMANVVRTASKLETPAQESGVSPCSFCGMLIPFGAQRDTHDHQLSPPEPDAVDLCYGCTTLRGEMSSR
ncbi:MAG: hypothetical protein Q9227_008412 [Pyrenula ochraceoflavens]